MKDSGEMGGRKIGFEVIVIRRVIVWIEKKGLV